MKLDKSWKEFLTITILGVVIGILLCPACLFNSDGVDPEPLIISVIYTYVLGYGCTFIMGRYGNFDKSQEPVRQFIKNLFFLAIYTFFTSVILMFFVLYYYYRDISQIRLAEILDNTKLPIFISLAVSSLFSGIAFLKNWRKEAVRSEKLEKEKLASQYESLRNQVNPHFLFNSLNTLSSLVYESQDMAVNYINQLSEVYRYLLDSKNKDLVKLTEELEFLKSYLYLQKMRFGENLNINIQISNADKEKFVLPLSLQLLIENAIKHNEVSSEKPLSVSISLKDQVLVIKNQKNPKPVTDKGLGIGLSNIKERYHLMTGKEVKIVDSEECFEVEMPLIEELK